MPMAALIQDDGRLLVANHMGVAVSEDRGVTWADASEGLVDRGMSVVAADPTCPARVFAASRCGGGVFSSDDYGTTWSAVDEYFHYVMEVSFDPIVADRVWAVSDDRLMRSDDAGVTWDEVWKRYHFHGFAVHPEDPDLLLLGSVAQGVWADTSAHVYRSEDGGETWGDSSTGLPESEASAHVIRYWPGNSDVVILGTYKGGDVSHATGEGVGLWRSADGGETWSQVAPDAQDIAALKAKSLPVPAPNSGGVASGKFVARVPKTVHAQLATRARAEGVSLNTLVLTFIAQGLGRKERRA